MHVGELRPNPRNPRVHGQEVLKLARTILRTAWGAPIIAQARSKRIIGGHGRLEAAKEILAGIEVDGELRGGAEHLFDAGAPGPGMVPVRLVDVSDAEADAMTLADNARGLQGRDDDAAVVEMASQFGRESALMADVGFDASALDALVKRAGDAMLSGEAGLPSGDAPTYKGDPDGREYDEGVEAEVDALTCPHCGKLVPRGS
jgi:ParB-like chromosome segregation protein Spo0J